MDKPAKLPDPLGPLSLSMAVPSSSIASANAEVRGVLEIEERTTIFAGKEAYTKVSAEIKAQIGKRAAEHGVAATVRHYTKKFPELRCG